MHRNSELIFRHHALPLFGNGQVVLEVGPEGSRSVHQLMMREFDIRLDWQFTDFVDRPGLTFIMDEYAIPQPDGVYDIVLSAQVIEHVRKPWRWLPELSRVCKQGGHVITICPVSWPCHQHPVDCWRMYPEGLRALHEEAGLITTLARAESLEAGMMDTIAIGRKI